MSKRSDIFEMTCADYLNRTYGRPGLEFRRVGGSDSGSPDVVVCKDGEERFRIEVKMDGAQCGQFVLFAKEESREFIYSKGNRPHMPSQSSLAIIDMMNQDFDRYKDPSPAELGLSKDLYRDRIVDYYENFKGCRFFMTRRKKTGEYVIFPTRKIGEYFDITACYRYKPSGSHNPNAAELERVVRVLQEKYGIFVQNMRYIPKNSKESYTELMVDNLSRKVYRYESPFRFQLSSQGEGFYRLTILGSTNNPNVIFTVKAVKDQEKCDLAEFLERLR